MSCNSDIILNNEKYNLKISITPIMGKTFFPETVKSNPNDKVSDDEIEEVHVVRGGRVNRDKRKSIKKKVIRLKTRQIRKKKKINRSKKIKRKIHSS